MCFFGGVEVGQEMRKMCSGKKEVKVSSADVICGDWGMQRKREDVVCDGKETE